MTERKCPLCGSKNITIEEHYETYKRYYQKKITCKDCGYIREEY